MSKSVRLPTARSRARALVTYAAVAAGATAAAAPATASAAADIGPERIVVRGPQATAVIARSPFRLELQDRAGRTVLRQVANTRQAPMQIPPSPDAKQLGLDTVARPTLYAPLTFTVGARRQVEHAEGLLYGGNHLAGVEGGTQYSAHDVLEAGPQGEGVRLVVSTSDPSGRRLVVTVGPDRAGTIRVRARPTPEDGVVTMADSFAAAPDEAFHGFGGRHNAIDQRGQDFYNWTEQENFSGQSGAPLLGDRYQFPNGPTAAYYPQALFYGSGGFGFLLAQPELARFRMASDRPDAWQAAVAAPELDLFLAAGDAKQTIGAITGVSGRHRVPPRWAAGPQTTRLVGPQQTPEEHEATIRDDLRKIDETGIPTEGYDMFGWQLLPRKVAKALVGEFHRRGIKVTAYFRAYVADERPPNVRSGYDVPESYPEAIDKGYVATTPDGKAPYLYVTVAPSALIDFTNPAAVGWWRGRIREALDLGFDGFMQDFGEQVTSDMRFANGETGTTMHNRYPAIYHRVTRGIVDEYEREHPGREVWFYTRSGYSGVHGEPGAAAFESANFPGDNNTDFSRSNGLASMTTDMVSRAVGGLYGYTTDIGGYCDCGGSPPTTKELLIRWAQAAALSPHFRLHNTQGSATRQPWFFDAETVRLYKAAAELHVASKELRLRLVREAQTTGVPPVRPLWLEFPGDAQAAKQDQQWMLGPDVLVAPVVTEGATARDVYFPRGEWVQPETGERFAGPRTVRYAAPLGRLPYFFRAGTRPFTPDAELGLPAPTRLRSCTSRRAFRIRLRAPRGQRLTSARILVNGREARTLRGRRLRAAIDLRGLPRGRFTVRIVARTTQGRTLRSTRAYRTCVPRRAARR